MFFLVVDVVVVKGKDVVYVAKVLRLDNFDLQTYTGVQKNHFMVKMPTRKKQDFNRR